MRNEQRMSGAGDGARVARAESHPNWRRLGDEWAEAPGIVGPDGSCRYFASSRQPLLSCQGSILQERSGSCSVSAGGIGRCGRKVSLGVGSLHVCEDGQLCSCFVRGFHVTLKAPLLLSGRMQSPCQGPFCAPAGFLGHPARPGVYTSDCGPAVTCRDFCCCRDKETVT